MRWTARAVKVILAVFLLFAVSLFFREQDVPRWALEAAEKRLPGLRVDAAAFGLRHGLRAAGIRYCDETGVEVFSASHVNVGFFSRTVRIDDLRYPRLPDSWYAPLEAPPEPRKPDIRLPDLPAFTLVLSRPSILGIEPLEAVARVECANNRIVLLDAVVEMSDRDVESRVSGRWVFDADAGRIDGDLAGRMHPGRIRPLLTALDVPSAAAYMDAFTEIRESVPASFSLTAGIERGDVAFTLSLSPKLGRYNGVALERAEGKIAFSSSVPADAAARSRTPDWEWRDNVLEIDMPYAIDASGGRIGGVVKVSNASGRYRVQYDVRSNLPLVATAMISEVANPAALSFVRCDEAPVLTMKGAGATSADDFRANDLNGTAALKRGAVAGFEVRDASAAWTLVGDRLAASGRLRGRTGGRVAWNGEVSFAEFGDAPAAFSARARYSGGSLDEIADVLAFNPGERRGTIDAEIDVSGLLREGMGKKDVLRTLNGSGRVRIHEGMLARMKLFAGLTDLLADKVAGIGMLTDQSEASADFTVKDGVLHSDNVYIEGSLVSVKAWGDYDLAEDNLAFTVRVQLLRSSSIAGMVLHPLTYPFMKLLLEFRLTGPASDPQWHYIKPFERMF